MPIITAPAYKPSFWLRNGHFHTIYPYLFAKPPKVAYQRFRLELPDGDFMDLDFAHTNTPTKSILIVLHGLEGSAESIYVQSLVRHTVHYGWDALAVNQRGCSGEPNRLYSAYHSGKTDDLQHVLNYLTANHHYTNIFITGFSLGGNITLKYMGENGDKVPAAVKAAVAVSVPCDLVASSNHLARPQNSVYMARFLKSLKAKARMKKQMFPESAGFSVEDISRIKDFKGYDDMYTAPAHGFADAMDYWTQCSSKRFLNTIAKPTLLIQSADDPFLPVEAIPYEEAKSAKNLHLCVLPYGGHVGFVHTKGLSYPRFYESMLIRFLNDYAVS